MARGALLFVVALVLLAAVPSGSSAVSADPLSLQVYSDGYVHVAQTLAVDPKATSVQVPLLVSALSNLVATDQNGSPLSYSFNSGGTNITVYSLGATSVTVRYESDGLTTKNGTVWTLSYSSRYNSTVVLPQRSTLVSVSGAPYSTPYSINETSMSPEVTVPPGSWRFSYGVPIGAGTSTTTSTSTGPTEGPPGLSSLQPLYVGAILVGAAAVGGLTLMWWNRRGTGPPGGDLRPDDVQVLNFIGEKGGKVLEPEIRMRFALPKTSAWRQIKRLERLGYVKVTKIGSQNQIEILKERDGGESRS